MEYEINIKNWGRMFTVPCSVVDDYIKIADGKFIKVLLCLLCSNSNKISSEELCEKTGILINEVEDSIEFWRQMNIITIDNHSIAKENLMVQKDQAIPEIVSVIQAENPTKNTLSTKTSIKYSPKDIEKIVQNSSELKFMMDSIQIILKRPITYTEQSSLIHLHEYYGFSVGIILMLFEYCEQIEKTNIGYVEAIARSWFEKDITTHEAVEKEIIRLIDKNTFEHKVAYALGLETKLTPKQKDYIEQWNTLGMSIDMILFAYEKCVDQTNKLSFPYINKIINSWTESGYTKREDVAEKEVKPTKTNYKDDNKEHSYNLEEIYNKSFMSKSTT